MSFFFSNIPKRKCNFPGNATALLLAKWIIRPRLTKPGASFILNIHCCKTTTLARTLSCLYKKKLCKYEIRVQCTFSCLTISGFNSSWKMQIKLQRNCRTAKTMSDYTIIFGIEWVTLRFHEYDNVDNVKQYMCRTWSDVRLYKMSSRVKTFDKVLSYVIILVMEKSHGNFRIVITSARCLRNKLWKFGIAL